MKIWSLALRKTSCTIFILFGCLIGSFAQDEKADATKATLESQHYVFNAQTVSPSSGRTRQLTTTYTVKVTKDTVIADLPYFGRSYSAPTDLSGGGINFTSMQFDYSIQLDKKKRWQIEIKPKDVNDVRELLFTVFDDGTTDLRVNSRDRQPISFRGYITAK